MRALSLLSLALLAATSEAEAQLVGVTASRSAPVIAAWTDDTLFVSRDDGASFVERYDALADRALLAAAVDDDGTILLGHETRASSEVIIERIAPDGTREALPGGRVIAVAAGGGTLAFVSDEALWVARSGAPFVELPHAAACTDCDAVVSSAALAIDSHGEVVLTDVEINTCGSSDLLLWQRTGRVRPGETSVRWSASRLPDAAGGATMRPGVFGWTYGVTVDGALWARSATRSVPLTGLEPGAAYEPIDLATNGRIALLLWGGQLLQLRGERVSELDAGPADVAGLAVDGRGRALAIDADGGLVRFSRHHGWGRLLDPPT